MERAVQAAKSSCKYRAHAYPEPTIGRLFLLSEQVLAQQAEWAARFPELLAPAEEQAPRGASSFSLDEPADASSSHLLGLGDLPDGDELEVFSRAAQQAYAWQKPEPGTFLHDWHAAVQAGAGLEYAVYQRAALRGVEIVHAESYLRSNKPSYFCLTAYDEEQPDGSQLEVPYAAKVQCFVKVSLASLQPNVPPSTQRFAIADLLRLEQKVYYGGSYFAHNLKAQRNPLHKLVPHVSTVNYPVALDELKRKLVWCPYDRVSVPRLPQAKQWLFTQYHHNTSYVDAESAAEF